MSGIEGVEVRWATDEDIPEIFSLIKELAEFEKALDCVKTTEAQLASDLRAKHFVAVVATSSEYMADERRSLLVCGREI